MSNGITLSSATRQNLLSLQGTADLLATTQNRLATNKKVNSALDNPTNFFTADALSSRSTGLSKLLDGISNGIQTIQAANTGLTKLQGLTDQLKSVAQQALSSANAFTAKAVLSSTTLTGATASNLLSVGATVAVSNAAVGSSAGLQIQTNTGNNDLTAANAITTALGNSGSAGSTTTITIDGKAISLVKGTDDASTNALLTKINDTLTAAGSAVRASLDSTTFLKLSGAADGTSFTVGGEAALARLFGTNTQVNGSPAATNGASLATTALSFTANDTFTVNGQAVTVSSTDTISSLAQKVSVATNGAVSATFDASSRKFSFTAADSSTTVNLADGTSGAVAKLGYTTVKTFGAGLGTNVTGNFVASALDGKSLQVSVGGGSAVSLTFGKLAGQISSLTQLNATLATANAQASIDSATGKLTITTTNDNGADGLSVTGAGVGNPFGTTLTTASAVIGGDGATARNGLVATYNNLLTQVNQLAADAGFNGLNLLAGDNLKLSFNEKNSSTLNVQGSAINTTNLGLNVIGTNDFQENGAIAKVMSSIGSASAQLKAQASSLGSNLAVVQNRQDFTKQIINVLDTGAANLTNADLNEEAANSQALSTRNSLGISALSLANQAQQSVLQLLR